MSDNWKMQDDEAAMPIGTGSENTTSEIAFPAEKKPRVQGMTAVLTLVFIGGLAVIYSVGLMHKPRVANAAQSEADIKINSALERFADKTGNASHLNNLFADTDKLVKMFYEYPGKASVPVEALPVNPFEHLTARAPLPDETIHNIVPQIDNNAAEEERIRKLAESFATLKLQTVMVSTGLSMAQINGKLVQAGAKIGEFTVDSIESKRVILRNGDHKFELLLDQGKPE